LFEKDGSQLGVSQGEGPQTEVGGGVADRSKDEFNRFNQLVDNDLHKIEFLLLVSQQLKEHILV